MAVKVAEVWDVVVVPPTVLVDAPVSLTTTSADAVAVLVPGAYWKLIVQLAPVARTVVAVQVPPVMENVPPVVPALLIAMPVNVMGPEPVPLAVLETVIVAVLLVVVGVVVVNVPTGALKAITPWVTINPTALLVLSGVLTVTLCVPMPAVRLSAKVVVMVVELTTVTVPTVTPVPLTATVEPVTKLVPVSVTGTEDEPRVAEVGLMEVSVGPVTVKLTLPVCPIGVVTLTALVRRGAVADIANVVVSVVEFTTVTAPGVMPDPVVMLMV